MADFSVSGISELNVMCNLIGKIPEEVINDVLTAMGTVAVNAQQQMGKRMGIYDPNWDGQHVLDSIKLKKPKIDDIQASIIITFKGTRKRGNTTTRNAEIAFINEFGADKKGIKARPFIKTANALSHDKMFDAGEKVWNDYVDKICK